jgi:hypothetical protein
MQLQRVVGKRWPGRYNRFHHRAIRNQIEEEVVNGFSCFIEENPKR